MNPMQQVGRALLLLLCLVLGACTAASKLKFWEEAPSFDTGELKVAELRRALLCGTQSEAPVVHLFDSVEALKAWDSGDRLQLDRVELPTDRSFVLLEQGRRQTGGYTVELRKTGEVTETGVLQLQADWLEPAPDRMVTQIITSLCVLAAVAPQPYTRVEVRDSQDQLRASRDISRQD